MAAAIGKLFGDDGTYDGNEVLDVGENGYVLYQVIKNAQVRLNRTYSKKSIGHTSEINCKNGKDVKIDIEKQEKDVDNTKTVEKTETDSNNSLTAEEKKE